MSDGNVVIDRLNAALADRYRIDREPPGVARRRRPEDAVKARATGAQVRTLTIGLSLVVASCVGLDSGEEAAAFDSGEQGASIGAPVDGYVEVEGVKLHYRDYGGEGDLMVFVHGFFMTAHVYDELAPHFTDRYRVLAVTKRWHGTSDTTSLDFDLDTLASDLAGFIDHFTDDPAVVFGWVSAGLELPGLARRRPDLVRALIFANAVWAPVPLPPDLPRWPPGDNAPDSMYPSLEAAARQLGPAMNIRSTTALLGVLDGNLYRRQDGMYAWRPPSFTRAQDRFVAYYDSAAVYEGMDVPVLAIDTDNTGAIAADLEARGMPGATIDLALRWAREYDMVSRKKGIEALLAAVPDAEVVTLDDVNHNFVIDNPDVVARIVNDYLDRFERQP